MKANYVHKDTLTATDYVDLNKENELLLMYNQTLLKENQELKKQLKDKTEDYKRMKDNFDSKVDVLTEIDTQRKEFIKYLEDEKDRLIKGTSHYYIDSFDRQHSVNETIYDEVDVISQKYKSIIGVSDENN